jgi:hypothetical protein
MYLFDEISNVALVNKSRSGDYAGWRQLDC